MPKASYSSIELLSILQPTNRLAQRYWFALMPKGRPPGYQEPPSAWNPQVGRLLQTMAAGKPGGRVDEQGSGAGLGTAWLASGLAGGARLVSAELDPHLATAVGGSLPAVRMSKSAPGIGAG